MNFPIGNLSEFPINFRFKLSDKIIVVKFTRG